MTQDTGQNIQGNDPDAGQPATGASSSLPDPTTKPLEGKVEAEKSGYASELVAYRVIDNLALVIANRVETALKDDKSAKILLVDDLNYTAGGLALAEIKAQADGIESAFNEREREHRELLEPAEAPARALPSLTMHLIAPAGVVGIATTAASFLPQIPKAVGAVADLLAYFRSDYKVSGREMSVSKQALLCSTAGSLSGRGLAAFIPGFYKAGNSPLLETLTGLARQAARLKIERDYLAEELPEASKTTGEVAGGNGQGQPDNTQNDVTREKTPDRERLAQVAKAVRETDAALLAYEGFRTAWTTPPETKTQGEENAAATPEAKPAHSEASKLTEALVQEQIDKLGITHLLWLSNFSGGGESTVRDRLWRKDRVGFMGGAAVGYILACTEGSTEDGTEGGRILAADTLAQFGVTGGTLEEFTEGRDFEDIDYKPDYAHGRYTTDDS
jgi:hypothetical protein